MATSSNASPLMLVDGSTSFDDGVDSNKASTLASEINPNGLSRASLAWLTNGTVRGGGVTSRYGNSLKATVRNGTIAYLFQGSYVYEPRGGNSYIVALISGVTYRIDLQSPYAVTDLTGGNPALLMPTRQAQAYFCQAEEFLVIQSGDYVTLPLFWDGTTLIRSVGYISPNNVPGAAPLGVLPYNEIPAAGPMDYYMGRLWYANGRQYSAGDIVGGGAGTNAAPTFYRFRDSVLKVTENPLVVGGDGFTVPTNAGNIRALKHAGNLDQAGGEGPLYIFTRRQIYSLAVPVTRTDWIAATNDNQPLQRVVQFVNGAVNDRSIAAVNGDLFYQSLEPSIRSLISAVRYYQQWGNTPIAANEDRILKYNDRSLLTFATGIEFNNYLLQSALPEQSEHGVIHKAIIPLDFDPISSFNKQHEPAWLGHWEGLDIFQMHSLDYNGVQQCYCLSQSRINGDLQLWQITDSERSDVMLTEDFRITWIVETPAYTFDSPFKLKELKGGEIWLDRVYGKVTVQVWYRVDADPCWIFWHVHELCVARNNLEDVNNPDPYPVQGYSEGYKWPIVLPTPPFTCDSMHIRPTNRGYQYQMKIAITGFARIRTVIVYGTEIPKSIYEGLTQQNTPPDKQAMP